MEGNQVRVKQKKFGSCAIATHDPSSNLPSHWTQGISREDEGRMTGEGVHADCSDQNSNQDKRYSLLDILNTTSRRIGYLGVEY